jgi:hypothetical protein
VRAVHTRYAVVCTLAGLALCWVPTLFHGPIAYKFDIHMMQGRFAVWDWYLARAFIGFFVGITVWPLRWYVRGPLVGFMLLLPPGMMSLANPECGPRCMFWNEVTGTVMGLLVGGVAYALTRRHSGISEPR